MAKRTLARHSRTRFPWHRQRLEATAFGPAGKLSGSQPEPTHSRRWDPTLFRARAFAESSTLAPPRNTHIWLAAYLQTRNAAKFLTINRRSKISDDRSLHVVTCVMNRIAIQLLTWRGWKKRRQFHTVTTQTWPSPRRPIRWPPPQCFDDRGLETLTYRFRPKKPWQLRERARGHPKSRAAAIAWPTAGPEPRGRPMRPPTPRLQAGQVVRLIPGPPSRQHRTSNPMPLAQHGQRHPFFVLRHQLRPQHRIMRYTSHSPPPGGSS